MAAWQQHGAAAAKSEKAAAIMAMAYRK